VEGGLPGGEESLLDRIVLDESGFADLVSWRGEGADGRREE
jgi:hypothetical protein